jgi:hypothetical protein
MLTKSILSLLFLAIAIFAPTIHANASDRYDPYNHCGAPFCGSVGAAAAAGAVARMDRQDTPKVVEKPVENPEKV